jgi:hypothetical protein
MLFYTPNDHPLCMRACTLRYSKLRLADWSNCQITSRTAFKLSFYWHNCNSVVLYIYSHYRARGAVVRDLAIQFERWYVGMTIPEGGVSGLPGVVRRTVGCWSGGLGGSQCWVYRDLVSCGRRGSWSWSSVSCGAALLESCLLHLHWSVRVCSSHSTHDIFSPTLVGGRPILVGWSCVGFAPVVLVLAWFSVN